jgi:hypothetical protein
MTNSNLQGDAGAVAKTKKISLLGMLSCFNSAATSSAEVSKRIGSRIGLGRYGSLDFDCAG